MVANGLPGVTSSEYNMICQGSSIVQGCSSNRLWKNSANSMHVEIAVHNNDIGCAIGIVVCESSFRIMVVFCRMGPYGVGFLATASRAFLNSYRARLPSGKPWILISSSIAANADALTWGSRLLKAFNFRSFSALSIEACNQAIAGYINLSKTSRYGSSKSLLPVGHVKLTPRLAWIFILAILATSSEHCISEASRAIDRLSLASIWLDLTTLELNNYSRRWHITSHMFGKTVLKHMIYNTSACLASYKKTTIKPSQCVRKEHCNVNW